MSSRSRLLTILVAMTVAVALAGCSSSQSETSSLPTTSVPTWVERVYPAPNSTTAVPDSVEVRHTLQAPDDNVRLLVDGVDVTTYATFDAGKLRYESGAGPVVLTPGEHTATVERVTQPVNGSQFRVLDSYTWSFRAT